METLNRLPFKAKKSLFEKLEKIVDIASLSKEERVRYDESIKVYRDSMAVMAYEREEGLKEGLEKGLEKGREEGLEKGLEKGREEGLEKGLEKGREEGLEKGLEKGREEGLEKGLEKGREEEKRLMVRNLKSLALSIENIMQVTGLSAKEIEEI